MVAEDDDEDPMGIHIFDPHDASYRPTNQSSMSFTREQSINKTYVYMLVLLT